ncbi:hypothetical protein SK128_017003 [Halocaridina rubra]|uniref:Uncharacterized protein n=1 Tax=Halocaridina rubra TaxID=373956 RepID=A0AAN9A1C5_HALRR
MPRNWCQKYAISSTSPDTRSTKISLTAPYQHIDTIVSVATQTLLRPMLSILLLICFVAGVDAPSDSTASASS